MTTSRLLPGGLVARPLSIADATAVYDVMAAEQQQTIGRIDIEEADILADWARPSHDLASSSVGVLDGDRLVGYAEVVGPLLRDVPHAAALWGTGSDVLGYDTAQSADHGWGPRMQVFVAESDVVGARAVLEARLPTTFRGWPVRYGWDAVPVQHHVRVATLAGWLTGHLGVDPRAGMTAHHFSWQFAP